MNISDSSPTRVILFQIRQVKEKISRVVEMANLHFEKKESLILFVEDEKAALFVDELLWKIPPTSFLPHTISEETNNEFIAISRLKKNTNQARYAFNLCPTPLLIEGPFKIIYDFEDLTTPSKQQFSALRFDAYKKASHLIEASTL
jgi:DNA polymerase-3 subunit chi